MTGTDQHSTGSTTTGQPLDPAVVVAKIQDLCRHRTRLLTDAIQHRTMQMLHDSQDHLLLYRALGVNAADGQQIDLYQNKGRFLYNHAGRLIEEAAMLCFKSVNPKAAALRLPNPSGTRPKVFSIDCLSEGVALEFKWRDGTTDGDHVAKELAKLEAVVAAGMIPVRLVFFAPNRASSQAIQTTLARQYAAAGGRYLTGGPAFDYVAERTGVDLAAALQGSRES